MKSIVVFLQCIYFYELASRDSSRRTPKVSSGQLLHLAYIEPTYLRRMVDMSVVAYINPLEVATNRLLSSEPRAESV